MSRWGWACLLAWGGACQAPDQVCAGAQCACRSDDDCVLTAYRAPVAAAEDCYCDDVSCGTAAPLAADAAEQNQDQWASLCEGERTSLCVDVAHCALHAPAHATCVGRVCAKTIDD